MIKTCGGAVLLEREGRSIIECKKCGYAHVYPMYSERELEKFYEDDYAESTPSHTWFEKAHTIKKLKKPGEVLDIGCWDGMQLSCFKDAGWRCTGTELNKRAASCAAQKGIEVHQISIQRFFSLFPRRRWDVINVAYVLEHIIDPLGFLLKMKKHLKTGGILIVEVPNEFSPLQLAYLKKHAVKPYWIALPDHVNYFNKQGIESLTRKAGYQVVSAGGSFPMEMFLLMGDDYLKQSGLGKTSFGKVLEMEKALREYDEGILPAFYSALYGCGIGRSIVLYIQARR